MDFAQWKLLPPVVYLAKGLGLDEELALAADWDDYKKRFIAANGDTGQITTAARNLSKKASTTEIAVLSAMLAAGDFAHVADEIEISGAWARFGRLQGDHADAVVFAIKRS